MSERRCPNCGGLVAEGVEFCQQCFRRIGGSEAPQPHPQPPTPERMEPAGQTSSGSFRRMEDGSLIWVCPACEMHNPIEAMACVRCGTPFRRVFAAEKQPPKVAPGRATRLSLLFPGLGHHALGRTTEGLAHATFFLWSFGTAIAILLFRRGQDLGRFGPLIAFLGLAAVVLYGTSAVDAGRVARQQEPLLSTRMLLYGGIGMMVLTIGMMSVLVLGARS